MMSRFRSLYRLLLTVFAAFPTASAVAGDTYTNDDFGMKVHLPETLVACTAPADEHDHGPIIFLDKKTTDDCGNWEKRRVIAYFALYDVSDEIMTMNGLVNFVCSGLPDGHCVRIHAGLKLDGRPSRSYVIRHGRGWTDVFVVAKGPDLFRRRLKGDPIFHINYTVELHTDNAHLDGDLRTLRLILHNMEIFVPPGH